jgi:hypothetical protein
MTVPAESLIGARAAQGRVPDFFIVGQPKSGTTALYEMLRSHPQIYMPDVKEPLFFASDLRPQLQMQASDPDRRPVFPATYDEYLSLFDAARAEQRVGEASSSYLRSRVAASAIAQTQPAARIIAILREPASLLRSLHLQRLQEHVETEPDLAKAISLEDPRRQGKRLPRHVVHPQMLLYSEFIRYTEQLRRYHAMFAPEQMTILIYDDFRGENERTVRGVLRFLDVDDTFPIKTLEANPTIAIRSARLDRMSRSMQAGRGAITGPAKTMVKSLTSQRLRQEVLYPLRRRVLYRAAPPADERFMKELRRRFRGEVIALSEHLDRDLIALWGYDKLG